jgi:hypothetical protein
VEEIWQHAPLMWATHINILECHTVADLIKLATDKEEQLVASSASDITKLIQAELQCQNRKQFGQWHMQDALIAKTEALPEEEEETYFPTIH